MPIVNIPKSALAMFQHLIRFSAPDFEAFLEALSRAAPSLDRDKFWSHVATHVPQIAPAVIESVLDELFQMDSAMSSMGMKANEFADSVAEGAALSNSDTFPFEEKDAKILKDRLVKIFEGRKGFNITMKAMGILTDQDHVFLHSKILTDVRPVFDESGNAVDAFVIVHMLRVHYIQDSDHKDFCVALDTSDIQGLREVLDRADTKAKCLRGLVKTTGVPYLDTEE
jgi:hypothetical protein